MIRPTVANVVNQHIEESGFYWWHRQGALWNPQFTASQLSRFDRMLDAHLEGLRVAGEEALELAQAYFEKNQTPEDAFTYAYLCMHNNAFGHMDNLLDTVAQKDILLDGAAAALLWLPEAMRNHHLQGDNDWYQKAVLQQKLLIPARMRYSGDQLDSIIEQCLHHEDPYFRKQALRAIGEYRKQNFVQHIKSALPDTDLECRFEASVALLLLGEKSAIIPLQELLFDLNGHNQLRALLLWSLLSSAAEFDNWLKQYIDSPEYSRALLWSMGFCGKPRYLSILGDFISNDRESTLAGYILSHITGIDLSARRWVFNHADFTGNEQYEKLLEDQPRDDCGLAIPNPEEIQKNLSSITQQFDADKRYIAGKPIEIQAEDSCLNGLQPQRWQAAFYLHLTGKNLMFLPALQDPQIALPARA